MDPPGGPIPLACDTIERPSGSYRTNPLVTALPLCGRPNQPHGPGAGCLKKFYLGETFPTDALNPRAGAPRSSGRRGDAGRRSVGGQGWRSRASGTARPGLRSMHPRLRSPGPGSWRSPPGSGEALFVERCQVPRSAGQHGELVVHAVSGGHEVVELGHRVRRDDQDIGCGERR